MVEPLAPILKSATTRAETPEDVLLSANKRMHSKPSQQPPLATGSPASPAFMTHAFRYNSGYYHQGDVHDGKPGHQETPIKPLVTGHNFVTRFKSF
jgi:hypothetical protein